MNILSICALAIVTVIMFVTLKPKNGEIALMLVSACSVVILLSVLSQAAGVIRTVNNIVASAQLNVNYVVILLKVTGICLLTEFSVNVCKDAGSQSLASNISLAGKIMVTLTALPLYSDILNTVLSLMT